MQNTKTLAIVGLILGIVTIVASWFWIGCFIAIVTGIVGIILNAKAKKGLQANGEKTAMAVVGLILSIVGLVCGVIMSIVYACTACAAAALTQAASDGTLESALNGLSDELGSELGDALTSALS